MDTTSMPVNEDTVENTETQDQVNGSQSEQSTATSEASAEEQKKLVDFAEFERVQKELNQAKMHANQLENAAKKQQEEILAEQGKYKELWEKAEAERLQKEEQETLTKLRNTAIEEYENPKVKEAAQKLIQSNPSALFWSNAADEMDAKAQVKAQLDALAEVVGSPESQSDNTPPVNGNNPLPVDQPAQKAPTDLQSRIDRMKKFEQENANKTVF